MASSSGSSSGGRLLLLQRHLKRRRLMHWFLIKHPVSPAAAMHAHTNPASCVRC